MKRFVKFLSLICLIGMFTATLHAGTMVSVNFWSEGHSSWNDDPAYLETLKVEGTQSAGVWDTAEWVNFYTKDDAIDITTSEGATASITINNNRGESPLEWRPTRDPLLSTPTDGNADMMDAHAYGSEYDSAQGPSVYPDQILDITVSNISYAAYDVILYMSGNLGQWGDGKGKLVINDGAELSYTLIKGDGTAFDGSYGSEYVEITDGETAGNYFLITGLTGDLNIKTWGEGYNHLGLAGIQIMENDNGATDTTAPTPDPAEFEIAPAADGPTSISMTAKTGSDFSGVVQYKFTETSGNNGGTTSEWLDSPSYTDGGLEPDTEYTYTVTMRDKWGNMTEASLPASATTNSFTTSATDIFSVNFYGYGKDNSALGVDDWKLPEWQETVHVQPGQFAGLGDWNTDGWVNYNGYSAVNLTATGGSTVTFQVDNNRMYTPFFWRQVRTVLGDGNDYMMDGHMKGSDDPYDGSNIIDMTVTGIQQTVYDVIIYFAGGENIGNGSANIIFNGEKQTFTVIGERFDGNFVEYFDPETPCNYMIFKDVTGSSFSIQIYGSGGNQIGPSGIQFGVLDTTVPVVIAGKDWITWHDEPVTLNAEDVVVENHDPGAGDLVLGWSASFDPNSGVAVDFSDPNSQTPTVTITKKSPTGGVTPVTLTLKVRQADKEDVTSSITIDVYDNECQAGVASGDAVIHPTDFNSNCMTGLEDLAQMAKAWLVNYSLTDPVAK